MQNIFCPKYISVGLSNISYIKDTILPFMNDEDMLIHTCLSHDSSDQNLLDTRDEKSRKLVCYGLHCIEPELAFTAIGAGAEKIFVYAGDKNLDLTDRYHAIDLRDACDFSNKVIIASKQFVHQKVSQKNIYNLSDKNINNLKKKVYLQSNFNANTNE